MWRIKQEPKIFGIRTHGTQFMFPRSSPYARFLSGILQILVNREIKQLSECKHCLHSKSLSWSSHTVVTSNSRLNLQHVKYHERFWTKVWGWVEEQRVEHGQCVTAEGEHVTLSSSRRRSRRRNAGHSDSSQPAHPCPAAAAHPSLHAAAAAVTPLCDAPLIRWESWARREVGRGQRRLENNLVQCASSQRTRRRLRRWSRSTQSLS